MPEQNEHTCTIILEKKAHVATQYNHAQRAAKVLIEEYRKANAEELNIVLRDSDGQQAPLEREHHYVEGWLLNVAEKRDVRIQLQFSGNTAESALMQQCKEKIINALGREKVDND